MEEKKLSFSLGATALKTLILSNKFIKSQNLNCVTDVSLFSSLVLLEDSPIHKQLLSAGYSKDDITEVINNILNSSLLVSRFQTPYITLNISSMNMSVTVSRQVISIFEKAKEATNSNQFIEYNALLSAFYAISPPYFTLFWRNLAFINRAHLQLPQNDSLEISIPKDLAGCLEIKNTMYSPDETTCSILGRDKETLSLMRILAKITKRNAILVGEAGVGKTALVEKLTWMIVTGNCPDKFKDSVIVSLDVNSIIAGTNLRGSAEARFKSLTAFLKKYPQCILFIDEIHTVLGAGACRDGDLDLADALKPILARGETKVIGATTLEEYQKYFSRDSALKRRFEKILVKEPKLSEVYSMIKNKISQLEEFHNVSISKEMIDKTIFYASCFNKETKNPDRTLDLIDKSMSTAELHGKYEVTEKDILDNFDLNYRMLEKTPRNTLVALSYHEAGHCVAHFFSSELHAQKTTALSIMPAEDYYGAHVFEVDDEIIQLKSMDYFIQSIGCKLAGRIAEEMFSSKLTSGASSDLEKATNEAKAVVTKFGLSSFSKHRVYDLNEKDALLTEDISTNINREVNQLLQKAKKYASRLLEEHSAELKALVDALLDKHMLSGEEIEQLLSNVTPPIIEINDTVSIS